MVCPLFLCFYDASIVALEEYGLPIEVSKSYENIFSTEGDLDKALEILRNFQIDMDTDSIEKQFVARAKLGL